MNDHCTEKQKLVQWLYNEIALQWKEARNTEILGELLHCAEGLDREVVRGSLFWQGLFSHDWELADACVANGYQLNPPDLSYWGPLNDLMATRGDEIEVAKWLIDRGVDIERRGRSNRTPLQEASVCDYTELVGLLLTVGANPNSRTEIDENATPLMLATQAGSITAVRALLAAGADVTLFDRFGRTAKDWALKFAKPEILEALSGRK